MSETKTNILVEPAAETSVDPAAETVTEPQKPTFLSKLKEKRWTFKLKNDFTKYVTVEPLICFYMLQIFVVSLVEPYDFHKACVSLDQDVHFCKVVTINSNKNYQRCAKIYWNTYQHDVLYCKGLNERKTKEVDCSRVFSRYESNATKVFVKPEDYRFCKVIEGTFDKLNSDTDSLTGVSVMILNFLVIMIVSIWSDKYSKRKICLILPILGQLLISIIDLTGALSTYLHFEFVATSKLFIQSLSGGMALFLFGCFSYMNDETIRRKLLFRFGVICLILTIYRQIPPLYKYVYQYYHDDDSYLDLISINLAFNIICLLYVKVILNESKQEVINVTASTNCSEPMSSEVQSVVSKGTTRKYTKRKQMAKAFNLDVVWDYIRIIFRDRAQSGRLMIILFLAIIVAEKLSPYDLRMKFQISENFSIDSIDIDGAIFVIISATMLLHRMSDVLIAVLVIGVPIAGRLAIVIIVEVILEKGLDIDSAATDFYSPFKRIASCSFLLAYVDKNESRIFLIVQSVAYLPSILAAILTQAGVELYEGELIPRSLYSTVLLPLIVFCGLGFLYGIDRKVKNRKQMENFPISNGDGKSQVLQIPMFVNDSEFSTHL